MHSRARRALPIALMVVAGAASLLAALLGPRPLRTVPARPPVPLAGARPVPTRLRWRDVAIVLALLLAGAAGAWAAHDGRQRQEARRTAIALTAGDPELGRPLLVRYGCAGCHTIPGVPAAGGLVGPPLAGVSGRVYLGGMLTNTPEHMIRWIVNPRAVNPGTAMPVTGISPAEARHVAAYLYAQR
jgi:cytochrome c2